jgi:cytosine deaminase
MFTTLPAAVVVVTAAVVVVTAAVVVVTAAVVVVTAAVVVVPAAVVVVAARVVVVAAAVVAVVVAVVFEAVVVAPVVAVGAVVTGVVDVVAVVIEPDPPQAAARMAARASCSALFMAGSTHVMTGWVRDPRCNTESMTHSQDFMDLAMKEARLGQAEGGIPIGSVVVVDGKAVGAGHNQRVQRASAVLHAEMDALENAGRLPAAVYRRATLYSTLSPCDMCSGAALLYGIPRIVVGENRTFRGPEEYLRSRGVEVLVLHRDDCIEIMTGFIAAHPELWNEDIGE